MWILLPLVSDLSYSINNFYLALVYRLRHINYFLWKNLIQFYLKLWKYWKNFKNVILKIFQWVLYFYTFILLYFYTFILLYFYTAFPKKLGNSVTNSISSLLWISIVIPNFKSHDIIMSARVYFIKRVKGVSIMSLQDEQWRRTSLLCLYTAIFLFY